MTDRVRDALGRPVAPDDPAAVASITLHEPTTATAWQQAMHCLDTGQPFNAHEIFEQRWRCCPPDERTLWQGLAQWAAALTHRARGNDVGARSVARGASLNLATASCVEPVDLDVVRHSLDELVNGS